MHKNFGKDVQESTLFIDDRSLDSALSYLKDYPKNVEQLINIGEHTQELASFRGDMSLDSALNYLQDK